jgi:hypothetical protein
MELVLKLDETPVPWLRPPGKDMRLRRGDPPNKAKDDAAGREPTATVAVRR